MWQKEIFFVNFNTKHLIKILQQEANSFAGKFNGNLIKKKPKDL